MEKFLLYTNACARKDSRTAQLADALISKMKMPHEELRLYEIDFPETDEKFLDLRDSLTENGDFQNPLFYLARRFSQAERIVISAPYWDLSFPAVLKQYLEQINVVGITFKYSDSGVPVGLCRAKKLYYVTTAGGNFVPDDFGFGYVKALAQNFYGIGDVRLLKATGIDIDGADVNGIMRSAEEKINALIAD
ncbi:MAG: NAD(P)H-dependent oxidoreductase [Clostridia bacterium]|nr:NAD(P)H-dependent oxidoreductase [Clostridia bacterium]